jgi:glycolate oxidase iron-sulfur subunit
LLKKFGLEAAEALVCKPALQNLKAKYSSKTEKVIGKVGLFTGCIAEQFDRATLNAAIELLTAIGFEVIVPSGQSCCGAIHLHNGQSADRLIANNIQVFNALNLDAIIYTATGCGAMLSEYQYSDTQAVENFKQRLFDINDFVLVHWPEGLKLKQANLTVAVHEPCSQRNVLKNQQAVYDLLEKVPGLTIATLPDNYLCCGAGGTYMLTHPDNAAALRNKKIRVIEDFKADVFVSSNYGCATFLNETDANVIHPVVLLAQHIETNSLPLAKKLCTA